MSKRPASAAPRTFFLNEKHQLAPVEKGGGGIQPQYADINWVSKGKQISNSIATVAKAVEGSRDPLKNERYFVIADPVASVKKKSTNKKLAPTGERAEDTDFGGAHGRVFERLGLDLLQVLPDGKAVVHASVDTFEQLRDRTSSLGKLGVREQARWATIDAFEEIPLQLRVDQEWLDSLHREQPADVVIELQPVLARLQADRVVRAIAELITPRLGERLTGTGSDFSGRQWFRGKLALRSIRAVAKDFYSVQSLHPPLYSIAASSHGRRASASVEVTPAPAVDVTKLPSVAVVDLGVPPHHKLLAPFRVRGFYGPDVPERPVGDHGSFVASRIVFGDCATPEQLLTAIPRCAFWDAMVGDYPTSAADMNRVNDKAVLPALQGVKGAAPDVRVFNLSFGDTRPLAQLSQVERLEKLALVQDLDNFAFATDSLVVVAAGNTRSGVQPAEPYPGHIADPAWGLGAWACGFNTLVCGSYVDRISASGLVRNSGWPSPFTRIGPGVCEGPVPGFAAPGGNTNDQWAAARGMGVLGLSDQGLVEDRWGTSHAAPILSREAAITMHELARYCPTGSRPFAVLARAFLTLVAERTASEERVRALVERTLGHGRTHSGRLFAPQTGSAVILWQGQIESPADKLRVQIPIPLAWLRSAADPVLRLVVCWDGPVNHAATATWACRKLKPVVHLGPDADFVTAPRGSHPSYPVVDRRYRLSKYASGKKAASGDIWLVELSYDDVAPYPPAMDFDPRQRVAFAAELFDAGENPVDPQASVQALPLSASMIQLAAAPVPIRPPILVKSRA